MSRFRKPTVTAAADRLRRASRATCSPVQPCEIWHWTHTPSFQSERKHPSPTINHWKSTKASLSLSSSSIFYCQQYVKKSKRNSENFHSTVFSEQLGHWRVVRMQQDLRARHAASPGPVPSDLRQPHTQRPHQPLPEPGAARDGQHLPAEDLQRVADSLRVDGGEWCRVSTISLAASLSVLWGSLPSRCYSVFPCSAQFHVATARGRERCAASVTWGTLSQMKSATWTCSPPTWRTVTWGPVPRAGSTPTGATQWVLHTQSCWAISKCTGNPLFRGIQELNCTSCIPTLHPEIMILDNRQHNTFFFNVIEFFIYSLMFL